MIYLTWFMSNYLTNRSCISWLLINLFLFQLKVIHTTLPILLFPCPRWSIQFISMPPVISSPSQLSPDQTHDRSQNLPSDCLSCRVWGGLAHLGLGAYVGSHYRKMTHPAGRAFLFLSATSKFILLDVRTVLDTNMTQLVISSLWVRTCTNGENQWPPMPAWPGGSIIRIFTRIMAICTPSWSILCWKILQTISLWVSHILYKTRFKFQQLINCTSLDMDSLHILIFYCA